jgi:hypothetical protein
LREGLSMAQGRWSEAESKKDLALHLKTGELA